MLFWECYSYSLQLFRLCNHQSSVLVFWTCKPHFQTLKNLPNKKMLKTYSLFIRFQMMKKSSCSISPLHTIRLYSQTMTKSFFCKKIWISRNGVKTPLHTVRHRQQFSQIWIFCSAQRKIAFEFCPETAPSSKDGAERRTKNLFAKCRRKCSTHYSHFVAFSLFR